MARLLQRDPQLAIDWVESLKDPDRRQELRVALAIRWLNLDEEAASEWVAEANLSHAIEAHRQLKAETRRAAGHVDPGTLGELK
jgi:hypothetical protein